MKTNNNLLFLFIIQSIPILIKNFVRNIHTEVKKNILKYIFKS